MCDETSTYKKLLETVESWENIISYINYENIEEGDEEPLDIREVYKVMKKEPDDLWGECGAPNLELKQLPKGLKYAFIDPNSNHPVIIKSKLKNVETTILLCVLKKHRNVLGYSLDDIPGISPELSMHQIHLEDNSKISIDH